MQDEHPPWADERRALLLHDARRLAEAVVELFTPIQERYRALRADDRELQRLLAIGAEKARNASEPTLRTMYERMGFVMPASGRFFGAARPKGLKPARNDFFPSGPLPRVTDRDTVLLVIRHGGERAR